jgi:hypothetical protein
LSHPAAQLDFERVRGAVGLAVAALGTGAPGQSQFLEVLVIECVRRVMT